MNVICTEIEEIKIIEPECHGDNRGFFMETFQKEKYKSLGINNCFVQDNLSFSALKGTLRGIHFQNNPKSQAKLVSCIKGCIVDVAVDLRKGSPTYKKWIATELSEDNHRQLYIPQGFGHGFLTLTDNVMFSYKVDNYYSKENDRGIIYNDPEINIDWISLLNGIKPILSEKDKNNPLLKNSDCNFVYEEKQLTKNWSI